MVVCARKWLSVVEVVVCGREWLFVVGRGSLRYGLVFCVGSSCLCRSGSLR